MSIIKKSALTSIKFAKLPAQFASDKKAEDVLILDMRKCVNFCDFFVLCSGSSTTQVRAIADGITESLKEMDINIPPHRCYSDSEWNILDFGDVVIHSFEKKMREFYKLEYLWQAAKKVNWP